MSVLLTVAPLLILTVGALLLMLAEAFGKPLSAEGFGPGGLVIDAGAGRSSELALGAAVTLFAGAMACVALWMVGPENLEGVADVAPYLIIDRFSLFFAFTLCLGAGVTVLLAGGYMPEHNLDRGEFYPLLLFSTVGAIALAAAGDLLSLFVALETM
jgi:NADH-quinone oxidoreductase subunit N